MVAPNPFLAEIRAGNAQIGIWLSMANAQATEIVAHSGYDWALIDMEHSPNELSTVMDQLRVLEGFETTALVRPDWNDPVKVKRLLDMGAPGLLFPMVNTVEEAEAAVAATRYPPRGVRGVGGTTRATAYGRDKSYFAEVESQTAVLVQVETLEALDNIEAIAAVDGVDGIFFGPADIAADMGHLGQPMHDQVWAKILPAAMRLIGKKIPVGTVISDMAFARRLLGAGFTFVACGSDTGLLAQAADQRLADLKAPNTGS
ncbi:HpcH/HpaI aldolase/citrate lyase family protein [Shimia sp. R9_2]|uniref:HpcH/HpaI aldolase family protein n=1 Tax=Shimia sp. R9_2 TaxID=2821112 RepID=UPI001ADBB184|nr:HpcH/HpaI aldolase/citrate lyase family protein [Shimia sp. R9_2]MBO9398136.1 HpcH/HpaI aldolase/citrate lyase family protein [Shimia sp. R9_2]